MKFTDVYLTIDPQNFPHQLARLIQRTFPDLSRVEDQTAN